jgi:hypothetical protein
MNSGKYLNWLSSKKGILITLIIWIITTSFIYLLINTFAPASQRFKLQLLLSRTSILIFILPLLVAALLNIGNPNNRIQRTDIDLSIFRIILFGFLFIGFLVYPSRVYNMTVVFAELPDDALVDLPFMNWYPSVVPFTKTLIGFFSVTMIIGIAGSLLGFKTRLSIIIYLVSAFYLFSIPNFYGKVSHNHHLLWIPLVLLFSKCSNKFSLDSIIRKKKGVSTSYSPSEINLTLTFIWLIIGLIYLFPGFWKVWTCGFDWAFTDNMRNQFLFKWDQMSDWSPLLRIDAYPILYKSAGIFTLVFELSFIPLFYNKKTRSLALLSGILFHISTLLFLNIFFVVLVLYYSSIIPWSKFGSISRIKSSIDNSLNANTRLKITGWSLVIFITLFGFGKWNSWPFSVYPTFDELKSDNHKKLVYERIDGSGAVSQLNKVELESLYNADRYWSMENQIINGYELSHHLDSLTLDTFIEKLVVDDTTNWETISVYIRTNFYDPDKTDTQEKIYELNRPLRLDSKQLRFK